MEELATIRVLKILLLGQSGTGKSSLAGLSVGRMTPIFTGTNVSSNFTIKNLHRPDGAQIKLYLWEIPGWENRYGTFRGHRDADGAILVFDVTRPNTFEAIHPLRTALDRTTAPDGLGTLVPVVLIANKYDLLAEGGGAPWKTPVPREEMNRYCRENDFVGWYEISAKDKAHRSRLENALDALVDKIIAESPLPTPPTNFPVVLPSSSTVVDSKCWC